MEKEYETRKYKCAVCGKVVKKVVAKTEDQEYYPDQSFYRLNSTKELVCHQCEANYRLINNYNFRGYGYKYSTRPNITKMDKSTTPTFGVELEVAGNIKNIDKINKMTILTRECSIGYDTSVEGAQFELSYAPGTYYWYVYESQFRNVCKLIAKDPWAKESETIGTHIHMGNIRVRQFYKNLIEASNNDIYFWTIMKIVGEREFNQYCVPAFRLAHHDAISYNGRWNTIEFRFFSGTYDAELIFMRMRFIRQIYNNYNEITNKGVIEWSKFNKDVKDWMLKQIEKYEEKTNQYWGPIKELINGEIPHQELEEYLKSDQNHSLRESLDNDEEGYRPYWIEESEEYDEENEEY